MQATMPWRILENAGFNIAPGIALTEDIGRTKKPLHEDIGGDLSMKTTKNTVGRNRLGRGTTSLSETKPEWFCHGFLVFPE